MPRKLLVGKAKRKHTKKPNGWIPLGINYAIRQLFYFLFRCWFTPKGNWNKYIGIYKNQLKDFRISEVTPLYIRNINIVFIMNSIRNKNIEFVPVKVIVFILIIERMIAKPKANHVFVIKSVI